MPEWFRCGFPAGSPPSASHVVGGEVAFFHVFAPPRLGLVPLGMVCSPLTSCFHCMDGFHDHAGICHPVPSMPSPSSRRSCPSMHPCIFHASHPYATLFMKRRHVVGIAPAARWDGNGFGDGRECAQCMHGRVGACAHCIWRIRSQGLTIASGSMFPPCIVPVQQRLPMRLVCMALSHGLAGPPYGLMGENAIHGNPESPSPIGMGLHAMHTIYGSSECGSEFGTLQGDMRSGMRVIGR